MSTSSSTSPDPFAVLGLPRQANEAEVRARYLELVKQFPPDTQPDKFREIRAAYEATKDPLVVARQLIEPPGEEGLSWAEAIAAQKKIPPRLTPVFLLSLGNRDAKAAAPATPPQAPDA
jgi:hypothetical protein